MFLKRIYIRIQSKRKVNEDGNVNQNKHVIAKSSAWTIAKTINDAKKSQKIYTQVKIFFDAWK